MPSATASSRRKNKNRPAAARALAPGRARDFRAGKRQRRQPAGLAAQQRINRQQAEQRQQPRKLKFKFAGHGFGAEFTASAQLSPRRFFRLRNQFQRAARGIEWARAG